MEQRRKIEIKNFHKTTEVAEKNKNILVADLHGRGNSRIKGLTNCEVRLTNDRH